MSKFIEVSRENNLIVIRIIEGSSCEFIELCLDESRKIESDLRKINDGLAIEAEFDGF